MAGRIKQAWWVFSFVVHLSEIDRACCRAFQFGYVNAIIQAVKRSRGHGWDEIRTTADPLSPEVPKL